MAAILTFAQQIAIKHMTKNNEADYAPLESETEEIELQKLLGIALLQDLQNNPTTAENIALLDGSTFVNCKGQTIAHKGIRYVLAYLVYSRYIDNSAIKDTFTGHQYQDRTETRRVENGAKKNYQDQFRELALRAWEVVKEFLNENKDDYPLWECTESKKLYTPKFVNVKKTSR